MSFMKRKYFRLITILKFILIIVFSFCVIECSAKSNGLFSKNKQLSGCGYLLESYPIFTQDTSVFHTLKSYIWSKFYESNKFDYYNSLCIQDCISFTFLLLNTGEIKNQQFSKFVPEKIKKLIEKSIFELNTIPNNRKPFVIEWQNNKYVDHLIMQPIMLNFFTSNCSQPADYKARGFLSLLTKDSDSGINGTGPGMMSLSGDFNVKPFEGILLTPFVLQSPYR